MEDAPKLDHDNAVPCVLSTFMDSAIQFTQTFGDIIALSLPHIYVFALALCSSDSAVKRCCTPFFDDLPRLSSQIEDDHQGLRLYLSSYCATYSGDGTEIATGTKDGRIYVWDTSLLPGSMLNYELEDHSSDVLSVAYAQDDVTCVAPGSMDATIGLWTVPGSSSGAIRDAAEPQHWVCCVAVSRDGSMIVSGSSDKKVGIWNVRSGQLQIRKTIEAHTGSVDAVALSTDGFLIASGSADATVRMWDSTTGVSALRPFRGHTAEVTSLAFIPTDVLLVSGSQDNTVWIWVYKSGTTFMTFAGHTGPVPSVHCSVDGTRIVSGSADGTIIV